MGCAGLLLLLVWQQSGGQESPAALKEKGRQLLADRTRSAQARDPLMRAVMLAPNDPEAHYYLAQWACLHNEDKLCLDEAQQTLRIAPGNVKAELQLHTLIGISAERLNRMELAEAGFRKSLEANRRLGIPDPLAAYQYVDYLLKRARDDEAQAIVVELMEKADYFGPAYLERAKFLAKQGKASEAVEMGELALKLRGMDKEKLRAAHLLLARTYFQLGKEEEAQRHQAWVEQNP